MFAARIRRFTFPTALLLTSVVVFAGGCCCFTTLYDTGVYATWNELEHGLNAQPPAAVKLAGAEQTIEEQKGVTIRLPILFDPKVMGTPLMRNAAKAGGEPVEPTRIQPPGLDLPGYYITYEMFYPDGEGKDLPVYCYLGALPKGESKEAKEEILKQLKDKYPDAEWTDKTLKGASGEGAFELVPGLTVSGPQEFHAKLLAKPIETPGRMDIYVVPTDHATVIVAWRAPQEIAKRISFFEAAESSVASIKSVKPAEPIAAAPPSGGQSTGAHVQFPNAEVEIIPPAGFHKNARINGFQKEGSNTQITIRPQQLPAKSLIGGYNEKYFTDNNLIVAQREDITAGDAPAVLWLVERQGGGRFWQYVFGDDKQSFILDGELTEPDEATKTAVRSSLLTARIKGSGAPASSPPNDSAAVPEDKTAMKEMVVACLEHHAKTQKGPSSWGAFITWAEQNKPDSVTTLRELKAAGVVFFCDQDVRKASVGTSNSIFAYYNTVPQNGGVISFLDGSVTELTADEFDKKLASQRQFSPANVAKLTN